jgi:hypothetical protein
MHFFLAYHISIILISLFLFILLRHTSGGTIAASNPRVAAQGRAAENNALGGAAGFGGGGFNQGFGGGGFARRGPIVQQQTPFTNSVTGPRGNTVTQGAFGGTAVTGPGM